MSHSNRSEAAYAGLLAAVLDARDDVAGARFDAVLSMAEAAGEISPELARELRYWQKAASHAVAEHVRVAMPAVLGILETAAAHAARDVDDAADAWRRASDPRPVGSSDTMALDQSPHAPIDLLEHRRRALVAGLLDSRDIRVARDTLPPGD